MRKVIWIVAALMFGLVSAAMAVTLTDIVAGISAVVSIKALIATAGTVLLGLGMVVRYTMWGSTLLIAMGTAITKLGAVTADGKLTSAEIDDLVTSVGAVKAAWKAKASAI